jgi:hypothetical protein
MPTHDWSRVDSGIFHDFHQTWTVEIANALNGGMLPSAFPAMIEQSASGCKKLGDRPEPAGGVAVADAPPRARFVTSAESDLYASKADRIAIRHRLGQVVAVIEIISPGNKSTLHALRSLVKKAGELLRQGISLLVVDLFPPSPRDPQGIHKAIWDEIRDEPFALPPDKPLTVAAYSAGEPTTAYVEPVVVGDALPSLPIFLDPRTYVPAPLESTYEATWSKCPAVLREAVENPGS